MIADLSRSGKRTAPKRVIRGEARINLLSGTAGSIPGCQLGRVGLNGGGQEYFKEAGNRVWQPEPVKKRRERGNKGYL
jgi:hypothetical protein